MDAAESGPYEKSVHWACLSEPAPGQYFLLPSGIELLNNLFVRVPALNLAEETQVQIAGRSARWRLRTSQRFLLERDSKAATPTSGMGGRQFGWYLDTRSAFSTDACVTPRGEKLAAKVAGRHAEL